MGLTTDNLRWRPRVAVILLAVALLPLAGLSWLAMERVSEASAHRADVAAMNDTLGDLTGLLEVGALLADEKHWSYAVDGLEGIGLTSDIVVEVVDLDPWAELEQARVQVNDAAHAAAAADLMDDLVAVRADDPLDPLERNEAYLVLEAEIESRRSAAIARLSELPDGAEISIAVQNLRAAAQIRDDIALQLSAFFSLRFSSTLTGAEAMRQLIARDERYRSGIVALTARVPEGSQAAAVLDVIATNDAVERFIGEVATSVERTLSEGASAGTELDVDSLVSSGDALAELFLAADEAVNLHMQLARAAAADVTALAEAMDEEAASEARQAILLGAGVTLLSVIVAFLGGRAIIGPLRRMSGVADAMRRGSLDERVAERGPREMQSAARALNEAVAQLQLSEKQAVALASGDLDDPILETPAPGALGRSLREAVAHLASSLSEREDFRRRLAHAAAHDGLTGLPNRTSSLAHLDRALGRVSRTGESLAVLFLDLDGFRQVNDVHGHSAGDRVLVQVAQRLSEVVRQGDVVGRIGADEFIVVAEPVGDDDEAEALALRLLEAISAEIQLGGVGTVVGASVGIATSTGDSDPDALVREAGAAVGDAKRHGRGGIRFCDDTLRRDLASRGSVERGLALAIERDELVLHFQQLVDARYERPVSIEALVRWMQPDGTMVPPGEFIPVAEASDLIVTLDRWVLEHAATQLSEWTDDPDLGHLTLAVNISERHLGHPRLVDHVLDPLRAAGVDPGRLVVEVTESALLDDLASAATRLATLREHGVKVAIDDFGTGYTSLAHLRALPVDVLKVDQSFVWNLDRDDERSLVRMIIEVGHLFGLEVVAEGVEDNTQARELLRLGVDTLQGFHYSRPAPAVEVAAISRARSKVGRAGAVAEAAV